MIEIPNKQCNSYIFDFNGRKYVYCEGLGELKDGRKIHQPIPNFVFGVADTNKVVGKNEISTLYKKMALKLHPDKLQNHPNQEFVNARFQALSQYYDVWKQKQTGGLKKTSKKIV